MTTADLAADAAIRATVREALPGDALLTEAGVDDDARLASRRCWIVDPLDGTSYLIAGSDDFDTFVTLAVDGAPVVAVSLQPATGLLLGAVAGRGAWVQEGDGPRRRLTLSPAAPWRLATKTRLGGSGDAAALARMARALDARLLQPAFSLCPRCFLPPTPRIDAMVGLPAGPALGPWEWDIAPIDLIVREAGGGVSDLAGALLRYNQPVPRFPAGVIAAASPALHRGLLGALGTGASRGDAPPGVASPAPSDPPR